MKTIQMAHMVASGWVTAGMKIRITNSHTYHSHIVCTRFISITVSRFLIVRWVVGGG
jgi:hypothetical protein